MRNLLILFFVWQTSAFAFDHDHKAWQAILDQNLITKDKQGLFNYKKLKESPAAFNKYLASITNVPKPTYDKWSVDQKKAFLINAYNAFTVKLILDNYPVKSIKKIGGFFSNPWKKKFFKILGKEHHLDNLEHDYLRGEFKESLVHFAVVCASMGCPSLKPFAFTAKKLNAQLEQAANEFVQNDKKNKLDGKNLYLSKIFKWYGDDFDGKYGGYLKFISKKITTKEKDQKKIADDRMKVIFLEYDWTLNEQ